MKTYTGRLVDPMNLQFSDINIVDICHHLSHVCRFAGATKFHYSVAQHSILVSKVPCFGCEDTKLHAKLKFAHDFTEAYLGDIPRPLKRLPEFAFYKEAEQRAHYVICSTLGLPDTLPECVHEADRAMLVREGIELMNHDFSREYGPPANVKIDEMRPEDVREWFLGKYRQLFLEPDCDNAPR